MGDNVGNIDVRHYRAPEVNRANLERLQVVRYADIVMRVAVIYLLDFLFNDTLFALLIQKYGWISASSANTTALIEPLNLDPIDIMFSANRTPSRLLWKNLAVTPYIAFSSAYYTVSLAALCLLFATTSQLARVFTYLVAFSTVALNFSLSYTYINSLFSSATEPLPSFFTNVRHGLSTTFLLISGNESSFHLSPSIAELFKFLALLLTAHTSSILYRFLRLRILRSPTIELASRVLTQRVLFFPFYAPLVLKLLFFTPIDYSFSLSLLAVLYAPLFFIEFLAFVIAIRDSIHAAQLTYHLSVAFGAQFGVQMVVVNAWTRLNVATLLRVFWLSRLCFYASFLALDAMYERTEAGDFSVDLSQWRVAMDYLLARGSETIVALLGMTSAIATLGHYIGAAFQTFLSLTDDDDDERNAGSLTGILFLLLALQTGVTSLSAEKRLIKLHRNFLLLLTAILHFVHQMTNRVLMRLATGGRFSLVAHARAWIVAAVLVVVPCVFLSYLWTPIDGEKRFSPWLASVTIFAVEVLVKTIVSSLLYLLFVIDAHRDRYWPALDDYVYSIRAIGATIEFVFGVALLVNGVWILVFESVGVIRALMIGVHAYCNIWSQARDGWASYRRRRDAVSRLERLRDAGEEEVREVGDVCAICYQELREGGGVKVTECRHLFHEVCLRKWMFVDERCPMCHRKVFEVES